MSVALTDGAVRWQHEPFGAIGPTRYAVWKLLHVADDVIPMLTISEADTLISAAHYAVVLIDKGTGQPIGSAVSTGRTLVRDERPTGEIVLAGKHLWVGARRGALALPIAPTAEGGPDGVR